MKKLLAIILLLTCVLLSGCANPPVAQYIAVFDTTDGATFGTLHGNHQIFQTTTELSDYLANYGELYTLIENHKGEPALFATVIQKYDQQYFQDNALVLVALTEGSGSISHEVTAYKVTDNAIVINIKRYSPETLTDDMAYWHILVEIEKGDYSNKKIELNIKNINL